MEYDYNPQLGYKRTLFSEAYDFLVGIQKCEFPEEKGLIITAATHQGRTAVVKAEFLTNTVFRLQMFPECGAQEAKNPVFTSETWKRTKENSCRFSGKPELKEEADWISYGTEQLQLRFRKDYWEMSVYAGERVLTKQQVFDTNVDNRWKVLPMGYQVDEQGNCICVHETMNLYSDEAFWGFGEKFTDLNKRGQYLTCWQKDALSTNTEDSYKGHPFFMSSRGYAVLMNTFTRCAFDMGFTSQVSYQMKAEDAYLDYIFLAEPSGDYKKLLQQYVSLTGPIPMIPKWALGYWQSRCTYVSRQEIEEVVTRALEEKLPLDVIHIDLWQKENYLGCWEWDTERFPDPKGMIQWLKERHVHLSIWNYPYVTEDSAMFAELAERGFFVKNQEGKPAMFYAMADARYKAACFDFTNPEVLKWYKERIDAVLDMGVSVIKTDFSEAVPEDAVYFDGSAGVEGHNKITYLYARTVYDIMKCHEEKSGNMPLLWGRSGYAGSHRIPAAWAGDSSSSLNNHSAILKGGLSLAMSGVSFWGYDLGGFYNTAPNGNECPPTEEEYLRSVTMGMFMPLTRAHGKTPREPWNISERALQVTKEYDVLRHRMIPYLYSTACESHLEGIPMLRPLVLEYPMDPVAGNQELSYMLGGNLLIAPPFDRERYEIYLPEGKWRNLLTGEMLEGRRFITVAPNLEQLPVFQRENSILPMVQDSEAAYVPEGSFRNMKVQLFFGSDMETVFYDQNEEGQIQKYYFRAYVSEESCLRIETDMSVRELEVYSEVDFNGIFLNGELI